MSKNKKKTAANIPGHLHAGPPDYTLPGYSSAKAATPLKPTTSSK